MRDPGNEVGFVFNLVDLVGVEETEILPDMSENFKDFAVETRFVVAICSETCATFSTRTKLPFNGL